MIQLSVVTGGTSGIGLAIARDLAKTSDLALIYRSNHERAEASVADLRSEFPGTNIRAFSGDLGNFAQAKEIFRDIHEWDPRPPACLLNSAGKSHIAFLVTDSPEAMASVIEGNLYPVMNATYFAARKMYAAEQGRIVSISSSAAEGNLKGHALYGAAKAAVEAFTKATSHELKARNITINCVRPGLVRSPMSNDLINAVANLENVLTPMESVIATVRSLLSPEGANVTGQVLTVASEASWRRS